jgi:serine-type D-Ala-D-Ala carboxypeptidase (penicillin-binding protein 5/6)
VRTRGGTYTPLEPVKARPGLCVLAAVLAAIVLLVGVAVLVAPPAAWASGALITDLDQPVVICPAVTDTGSTAPHVTAKGAILVDAGSGTVLYSRNADDQLEMASTTKMMTAILILESLPLDKQVKVPAAAAGISGSALGLKTGETFTVEQLLYMMLVPSANDAAVTLAVADAGSVKAFVEKMNARAEEMGLKNTHFVNDCGLHADGHYSSARDLAKIASEAMKSKEFRKIVSTKDFTLPQAGGVTNRLIKTSNELLQDYSWVNGIKTGSTPWAGYCLVSSATKDGLTLISVVLGAKDQDTREKESKALLEYGFDRCALKSLVGKGAVVAKIPVPDPLARQVSLVTASSFSRRLLGQEEVTGQLKLSGQVTLPVEAGQVYGELDFTQGETLLGSVQLVAAQSLEVPTLRTIMEQWLGPWAAVLPLGQWLTQGKS